MKLSRALLIVLVLHVVAVAGIIAFNTIKSRQGAFPPPKVTATPAVTPAAPAAPSKAETVVASTSNQTTAPARPNRWRRRRQRFRKRCRSGMRRGNFYIVAKGDNPVKIAKKLKVSESDLLAANHIDDPRKLQIGQKLIVPKSKAKAKKGGD